MPTDFSRLKPTLLWKHFEKILAIPHCSGHERAIGDYILSVAKANGLEGVKDKVGNVRVAKKATPGHESAPGAVLQAHLDMVCEKNSDTPHDFAKDPIRTELAGDWLQAKGTTLGSDNGIGIAACLAAMEDAGLVHGPLEFLFTVDEETGLTGANKLKAGWLKGTMLLNLDSEEIGTFTIGCAGGADSEVFLPLTRKRGTGAAYRIKVFGYRGGHSGLDIHQGRANAIKLLVRLLDQARRKHAFSLALIEGGNKHNAIPREAWADIVVPAPQVKPLKAFLEKAFAAIKVEYQAVEKEAAFSFGPAPEKPADVLTTDSRDGFLNLLLALPHGVVAMHPEIHGLTETSTNLAIVRTGRKEAKVHCSSRSSAASALESVRFVIRAVSELAGARLSLLQGYPGWMPNLQSPLLGKLKDIHVKVTGKKPEIKAVHAGLECGIIGEKHPGMDMISFGPTIEHPHSPEERCNVKTVEEFWTFLEVALRELA
jgi:dipeptidase D